MTSNSSLTKPASRANKLWGILNVEAGVKRRRDRSRPCTQVDDGVVRSSATRMEPTASALEKKRDHSGRSVGCAGLGSTAEHARGAAARDNKIERLVLKVSILKGTSVSFGGIRFGRLSPFSVPARQAPRRDRR